MNPHFVLHKSEPIKRILQGVAALSILCITTNLFHITIFGLQLYQYLCLSPLVVTHGFVWQLVTSIFLFPIGTLTFGSILDILFFSFLFWMVSTAIIDVLGTKRFIRFFFISGILTNCIALFLMYLLSVDRFQATYYYSIMALSTLWACLEPNRALHFVFFVNFRVKTALIIGLLIALCNACAQGDSLSFGMYLVAFLIANIYATLRYTNQGPFLVLYPLELICRKTYFRLSSFWNWYLLPLARRVSLPSNKK